MWPGLGRMRLPARGRGLVLAALCAGLLSACEEEGMTGAAEEEGAGAVAFLDVDLESFEPGWDCAGTYPRGELVNRLNGYRLYRIGPIESSLTRLAMYLHAVDGIRPGCRFLVTGAATLTELRLPTPYPPFELGQYIPFYSLFGDMIRKTCGGWEHDSPRPSPSVEACSRRAERDILRRTAQITWNRPRADGTGAYTFLLFLDGEVIFDDGRRM
jgi:hypothetical protein